MPTDLRTIVLGKLRRRWSPRQMSGWLAHHFAEYPELQVSHETIYQALFVQSRGGLRRELSAQVALRQGKRVRRRRAVKAGAARSARPWAEGFNISTRPAEVTDRAVPGHWEGDLLLGTHGPTPPSSAGATSASVIVISSCLSRPVQREGTQGWCLTSA